MELNDLEFLLEAVKASPDNLPLRKLLASALLKNRRFAEAEVEYKEALRMAPQDLGLQMGLATAFLEQEKHGMASVIMEDILALDMPPLRPGSFRPASCWQWAMPVMPRRRMTTPLPSIQIWRMLT